MRKSVQGLLHWLSTRPKFAGDADRAAVQRDAEKALRFYESLQHDDPGGRVAGESQ